MAPYITNMKTTTMPTTTTTTTRSEAAIPNPNSKIMIGSKPTFLSHSHMQFLIMDAPRSHNLHQYIKECKKHNVSDIVRVCEPTYSATDLKRAGIVLHEMPYPDGHSPPEDVLDRWLQLVDQRFIHPVTPSSPVTTNSSGSASASGIGSVNGTTPTHHTNGSNGISSYPKSTSPTIAVHCVAGLGRAPVLVAIALIEFAKMDPVDAAQLVRKHRRGAINNTQLDWLNRYQRRFKKGIASSCCVVM